MSSQLTSETLAHVRDAAQLLVDQTGDHQTRAEALLKSAERDVSQAEAAALDTPDADVDQLRNLLGDQVQRSAVGAATARQFCVSAREQHAAACRLLADLDSDDGVEACSPNAVLVVDDYGDVRELVAHVLQKAGFVVRTAANGLEGLIAAYEMRPGVIVMDVAMPVLDGIEATRLIKASEATRHARVIAYTGTPPEEASVQKLFVAVLQKPASPDVVLATVQHVAAL